MAGDFSRYFYHSSNWQRCRASYIRSVFNMCEICKDSPGLILHHKITLTPQNIDDPYITLSWDNLMYLCLDHHNRIHGNGDLVRNDVMFDTNGQLIQKDL